MAQPILFDTCVFIHHFQGKISARDWINDVLNHRIEGRITLINDFEWFVGARNQTDIKRYRTIISFFRRLDIHVTIARRAAGLAAPFFIKSDRSISLGDYFLMAAAEYYHCDILTHNTKHFSKVPLKGVNIIPYTV